MTVLHCAHPWTEPQETILGISTGTPFLLQSMHKTGYRSILQVLRKQNNENRKFDFILGSVVISRSVWDRKESGKGGRGRKKGGKKKEEEEKDGITL